MNISPDGRTVRFKTEEKGTFLAEKTGTMLNTVRIIDDYERKQLEKHQPHKIILQHGQEIILRIITDIWISAEILGHYLAMFSFTNEQHHHHQREQEKEPYAHNQSTPPGYTYQPEQQIVLPVSIVSELKTLACDRTLSELLRSMIKAYTVPPHQHPPAWTLGGEDQTHEKEKR